MASVTEGGCRNDELNGMRLDKQRNWYFCSSVLGSSLTLNLHPQIARPILHLNLASVSVRGSKGNSILEEDQNRSQGQDKRAQKIARKMQNAT
jgi:hypothetical protein